MLKYIFLLLLLTGCCDTGIQTVEAISFRWLDGNVIRLGFSEKNDPALRKSPVIKVVTSMVGLNFNFGSVGNALAKEQRKGEIWLWVPKGAQNIIILDQHKRMLCNYHFGNELDEEETYELILKNNKKRNIEKKQFETKWVTIDYIPKGANLLIDDYAVGQTLYYGSLTLGAHKFRLDYHGEQKEVTKTVSKETGNDFLMEFIPEEIIPKGADLQFPEYPKDYEQYLKFLHDNVKYPVSDSAKGVQGKVYVGFFVSKTGKISNVHVLRGISSACDKEAVRVVKMMPNWIPGRMYGAAITMFCNIAVKFRPTPERQI